MQEKLHLAAGFTSPIQCSLLCKVHCAATQCERAGEPSPGCWLYYGAGFTVLRGLLHYIQSAAGEPPPGRWLHCAAAFADSLRCIDSAAESPVLQGSPRCIDCAAFIVLQENHHLAAGFTVLHSRDHNFLDGLPKAEYSRLRK
eukprot:scaffold140544_cov20-Tisochrysis_lutea.AAC.3